MTTGRDGRTTANIKLHDKLRALRDLGQHLGLFDRVEQHRHEHVVHIEHAANEVRERLKLLTSRAREAAQPVVVEAEAVGAGGCSMSAARTSAVPPIWRYCLW
jgi:hypothetical protein